MAITIHRGLTELKTLDDRITRAIHEGTFCAGNKRSNKKINGISLDEYDRVIQGSYDKVVGLISRRNLIKSAIVESNAKTHVSVAGDILTVAQAIERKASINYDKALVARMKKDYLMVTGSINKQNEELPKKLETYLTSILGNKDQAKPEEIEEHTKLFMSRNEWDFIDPLKIKSVVDGMEEKIMAFETDVDSVLSESNAVTFIDV